MNEDLRTILRSRFNESDVDWLRRYLSDPTMRGYWLDAMGLEFREEETPGLGKYLAVRPRGEATDA